MDDPPERSPLGHAGHFPRIIPVAHKASFAPLARERGDPRITTRLAVVLENDGTMGLNALLFALVIRDERGTAARDVAL